MSVHHSLADLASFVGGRVVGDGDYLVRAVATLEHAEQGDLAFLANKRYKKYLSGTRAGAVVLCEADLGQCPVHALVVTDPYVAYAKIAALLQPVVEYQWRIAESAVIANSASLASPLDVGPNVVIGDGCQLAADVRIGPGSVLGNNVILGRGTVLEANVTLWHDTVVGENTLIHSGAVIGADGFGIAYDNGKWIKVPQIGRVRIGSDVEIGANTTIDRGALEDTEIGDGVKLDNLIQIGHNVRIGEHSVVAAHTAIAGSTRVGKHCAIGGCVGIVGHLEICDQVQITGGSVVTKSISKPGVYSSGTPLETNHDWHKNYIRFKHLEEMHKRLRRLEKGETQ